ncbi:MAG: class I lanthipeptide [Thermoanaerobaculia bacterium]
MKKWTVKKLSLDRETLRQLNTTHLSEAQGAGTSGCTTTTIDTCRQTSCGPYTCLC